MCRCPVRGCICDDVEVLNGELICGFCEIGEHWTRQDETKHKKQVARHRKKFGEPLGYLKLVK